MKYLKNFQLFENLNNTLLNEFKQIWASFSKETEGRDYSSWVEGLVYEDTQKQATLPYITYGSFEDIKTDEDLKKCVDQCINAFTNYSKSNPSEKAYSNALTKMNTFKTKLK